MARHGYASIRDIEDRIDYVVIAVPALLVPKVLAECIEKGVKNYIDVYRQYMAERGE
jgi:acyl-CoA synthetase (NDP forming)